MQVIDSFTGKYSFLSNFYMVPVEYKGIEYSNSEAAFQHSKCKEMTPDEQLAFILGLRPKIQNKVWSIVDSDNLKPLDTLFSVADPSTAKRLGRLVPMREDWDTVKFSVMHDILYNKFTQNEDLKQLLLETNEAYLIEGNTWHDNIWGECRCDKCISNANNHKNTNNLGKLLMKIRDDIKK